MAENEGIDGSGTTARGNEWEVVSLTASAFAAAPGPQGIDQDSENNSNMSEELEGESSHALFRSRHFAFPVNESLQSEADSSQMQNTDNDENLLCELVDEDYKTNTQFSSTPELEASKTLFGPNLTEKEESLSGVVPNSSFQADAPFDETANSPNFTKFSEPGSDVAGDVSEIYTKDVNSPGESNLPCEAWWKRQAAFLYAHAKETNTLWSIFIAAAVMGLVCLGNHWRKERRQILQVKWHVSVKEEVCTRGGNRTGRQSRSNSVFRPAAGQGMSNSTLSSRSAS